MLSLGLGYMSIHVWLRGDKKPRINGSNFFEVRMNSFRRKKEEATKRMKLAGEVVTIVFSGKYNYTCRIFGFLRSGNV